MELQEFKDKLLELAFQTQFERKQIENLIAKYFLHKHIPTVQSTHKFIGRCRYNNNGEVFNHVKQLSYNPIKSKISLQRCNYKNQQVFYGALEFENDHASTLSTAILETCLEYIKQNDLNWHYITLTKWQINRPLNLFMLPYSEECNSKNPDFKTARENFDQIISQILYGDNKRIDLLTKDLEFISNIFCMHEQKSNYYRISSVFFNYLMKLAKKLNLNIDGLVYPSSNTESAGMNIVLERNLIDDRSLMATDAIMYKGRKIPNIDKSFQMVDASNEVEIKSDGKINFASIW